MCESLRVLLQATYGYDHSWQTRIPPILPTPSFSSFAQLVPFFFWKKEGLQLWRLFIKSLFSQTKNSSYMKVKYWITEFTCSSKIMFKLHISISLSFSFFSKLLSYWDTEVNAKSQREYSYEVWSLKKLDSLYNS